MVILNIIRGVSFPFRFGAKGGVVMTDANEIEPTHINESIKQIVLTRIGERVMESTFGSNTIDLVFQDNDPSLDSAVKAMISRSIKRWEPRINLSNIEIIREYGKINLKIQYVLLPVQQFVTTIMELGDVYGTG